MIEDVYFAELHTALFFAGKNHGLKLSTDKGLKLEYNHDMEKLKVSFNGRWTYVPEANLVTWEPLASFNKTPKTRNAPSVSIPAAKIKAQVSTPQDHVFADGAGKTRD